VQGGPYKAPLQWEDGLDRAFFQSMRASTLTQKIDALVIEKATAITYDVYLHGDPRDDGRWEARLEFVPRAGGASFVTQVETTQSQREDVLYWATGLSNAYFDGAFDRARRGPGGSHGEPLSVLPTPADPDKRLQQLRAIEREILDRFRSVRRTTLPTSAFFDQGRYANADYVRSFEELEKQWKYVVRETVGGVDQLRLTVDGADAIGLRAAPGEVHSADPPAPRF
jgi:hypothetical protein